MQRVPFPLSSIAYTKFRRIPAGQIDVHFRKKWRSCILIPCAGEYRVSIIIIYYHHDYGYLADRLDDFSLSACPMLGRVSRYVLFAPLLVLYVHWETVSLMFYSFSKLWAVLHDASTVP